MRFSIVYDDGTIPSASEGDDVTDGPVPGPRENVADLDIPDDLPDVGLLEAVERLLVDVDPGKVRTAHGSKGGLTMSPFESTASSVPQVSQPQSQAN